MPSALVTGAARGIGLEVCRQLVAGGFTVLAGARDPDAVPEGAGTPVRLDVTDQGTIAALRREVGELDVLVNNAAIHYDTWQSVLTADIDVAREALETNTLGAWRVATAFAPLLAASAHGRLVNVSSGAGALTGMRDGAPAYSLSKAALNALTLMLADALRRDGVLVNAVCPGWVATDMGGPGGRPLRAGASGIVWAATLPDDGPTGGFFRDGRPIPW
ncbi:MAG TPA: SDR family NAD(P)-dependent oxidoreductase [Solirubrobacteraceae bacterium]|nr:SDR family NAD(P)-dependent oxidoreductase [Solirubrobacteraceae bacterium]